MGLLDIDLDALADPAPDVVKPNLPSLSKNSVSTEDTREGVTKKRPRKRKLPYRADVIVNGKKYKGKRVTRDEADLDVNDLGIGSENDLVESEQEAETNKEDKDCPDDSDNEQGSQVDSSLEDSDEIVSDIEEEGQEKGRGSQDKTLKEEERAAAERLAEAEERDRNRAIAIKQQKTFYDAVVDLRIRLEPLMALARRFPHKNDRTGIETWNSSKELDAARSDALNELSSLEEKMQEALEAAWPSEEEEDQPGNFDDWRNQIMDEWGRKINVATGKEPTDGFKSMDNSVSAHMKAALESGKHLQKSRRVHQAIAMVGGEEMGESVNEEHFNDGELYRILLREIIDSGAGEGGGLRHAQLSKSSKIKKKRDRKLAKGRRLNYDVHEKLVGFMAPIPLPDPGPLDEIIAAMFGKRGTLCDPIS